MDSDTQFEEHVKGCPGNERKQNNHHIVQVAVTSESGFGTSANGNVDYSFQTGSDDIYVNYYLSDGNNLRRASREELNCYNRFSLLSKSSQKFGFIGNGSDDTQSVYDHLWGKGDTVPATAVEQIFKGGKCTTIKRYLPNSVVNIEINPYVYKEHNINKDQIFNMADNAENINDGNEPEAVQTANVEIDMQNGRTNMAYTDLDEDLEDNETQPSGPPLAQILPNSHKNDNEQSVSVTFSNENGGISEAASSSPNGNKKSPDINSRRKSEHFIPQRGKSEHIIPQSDSDYKWLSYMQEKFREIAGDDGEISLEEFKDALHVKKSFFAERFFSLFDKDHSGSIELIELMEGLRMLTKGTPAQKLKFLFDVYDVDGSGTIDREELKTVLKSCTEESSLSLSEENLDALTDVLFDSADADESGAISFEELKAELEKHPGVLENLTISAAQWLKPPSSSKKKKRRTKYFTKEYIVNNPKKIVFFFLYILVNIGLGVYAGYTYRNSNGFYIVARIGGATLNFNCMFILVLMLRKTITYAMMTPLAKILPLDQNIAFHKLVGYMTVFLAIVHTLAHIGNAIWISVTDVVDLKPWEILFTTKAGIGYVASSAFITGWFLIVILIIMFICSMEFVRRGGHFQVFYWTHTLYIAFWILVILHGPNFWKWFVLPGTIFLLEKLSRSKFIKQARFGKNYINEVNLLPSGVTHLVISKPEKFTYKPGDYVFIQIPVIASHEWHPFTVSSAPEMKGHFWLHVRSAGHWTGKLYSYFENYDPGDDSGKLDTTFVNVENDTNCVEDGVVCTKYASVDNTRTRRRKHGTKEEQESFRKKQKNKKVRVQVFIDGPYGTATREIFDTEHAVLVGAGIGITPYASILQSIIYRYKESKKTCPHCENFFFDRIPENVMKLKKVDFVWVNRDQKSFEWFVSLLTQLEVEQAQIESGKVEDSGSRILDMHMFMTAAQKKTDMKGIGLQIALDLMHQKDQRDLITGLKAKTQPGRPDWNKLFTQIATEKRGKVKVFFCGAPALGKIIKEVCARKGFAFSKENF